ncbi:MAG: LemA family protein [Desulfurobacteriaceae bacterium]
MGWLVLAILILLILALVYYYNRFVRLKNAVEEAWSSIDVQLKRRYDLIPNLVEVVKGYAKHEKETLERVIKARALALDARLPEEKAKLEGELSLALKSLFALAENYPELKANQNFLELQKSLSEIEEQIQLARRYYNAVVRDYNILIESFPSNLVAGLFGFKKKPFFEISEGERKNVRISF